MKPKAILVVDDELVAACDRLLEGVADARPSFVLDQVECDVFELNAEKRIVRQTIYADALSLQQQIGEFF